MGGQHARAETDRLAPRPCHATRVTKPRAIRDPSVGARSRALSTTSDVILAAGPTVVALAAIGSAVSQQRRGFRHERALSDLADARSLFDDAAVALQDASRALSGLERGLFTHGASIRSGMPDALPNADAAGESLKTVHGGLGVRLPADHATVVAFARAHDATREAVNAAFAQDPAPGADLREAWDTVRGGHERLIAATSEFMEAATATVGARLP